MRKCGVQGQIPPGLHHQADRLRPCVASPDEVFSAIWFLVVDGGGIDDRPIRQLNPCVHRHEERAGAPAFDIPRALEFRNRLSCIAVATLVPGVDPLPHLAGLLQVHRGLFGTIETAHFPFFTMR